MRQSVELAQRSRTPTARILQSLSPKDFDTATNSATALSRSCKTCHNFYKKS
jgi:cytochrome c556